MKIIKEIAGRIWALWGIVSFIITFFIIFLPSMFTWLMPFRSGQTLFIAIARGWMSIWLRLIGCPVKVRGKEHFIAGQTYIITCNHNSLLDVPLSSPFIPGPNKTIAKSSFTRVPFFGFYYMKGSVIVDRKSEKSRRESFDKMKDVLKKNVHMCIYPEGTRNRSAEPLKKFHDGAFKLAVATNTAVIPAVIFNTKKALPLHKKFFLRPQRLEMHFLEAVPATGLSAEALKDNVFEIMKTHYENYSN